MNQDTCLQYPHSVLLSNLLEMLSSWDDGAAHKSFSFSFWSVQCRIPRSSFSACFCLRCLLTNTYHQSRSSASLHLPCAMSGQGCLNSFIETAALCTSPTLSYSSFTRHSLSMFPALGCPSTLHTKVCWIFSGKFLYSALRSRKTLHPEQWRVCLTHPSPLRQAIQIPALASALFFLPRSLDVASRCHGVRFLLWRSRRVPA